MAIINDSDRSHVVYGTPGDDTIHGNGGDDDIYGRNGGDTLYGDNGNDWIWGNYGQDWINGGAGTNDLYGGQGADTFAVSAVVNGYSDDFIGDFTFDVDSIDVSAWGVSSLDQLRYLFRTDGFGDATLNAFYNGYDHYLTISGVREGQLRTRDFLFTDLIDQSIKGTAFDDALFGTIGDDSIAGRDGDDILLGGKGDDFLNGGRGEDSLVGGAGNDTLSGSRGSDILNGGVGADVFVFANLNDSRPEGSDVIENFAEGVDRIDVSGIDANHNVAGAQNFDFIGQQQFDAAGELRFVQDGNRTIVFGNVDSDSAAEFRIVLTGRIDLTGGDFILT